MLLHFVEQDPFSSAIQVLQLSAFQELQEGERIGRAPTRSDLNSIFRRALSARGDRPREAQHEIAGKRCENRTTKDSDPHGRIEACRFEGEPADEEAHRETHSAEHRHAV